MSEDESKEKFGRIELSKADTLVFLEALENPPEPNEKLKEAAANFKEMMG